MAVNDVTIRVGSVDNTSADFDALKARLDEMANKTANIDVNVDDKEAKLEFDKLNAQLQRLGATLARPKITVAQAAQTMAQLSAIDLAIDKINGRTAEAKVKVSESDLSLVKTEVEKAIVSGASSGSAESSKFLPAALVGAMENPEIAAGVAAAMLPVAALAGQLLSEGIVGGFGLGIAGIAIVGASKTQLVQQAFDRLKDQANKSLLQIGSTFTGVMNGLLYTAQGTLSTMTPVFENAAKTISKPFASFGSALISAFAQPAVQQSIQAVAQAFGQILKAVTPQLSQDVGKIADQISVIARTVGSNPRAFSDFVGFLIDIAEFGLEVVNTLTHVANWIEEHWTEIGPLLVGPFLAMTKPIENSLGQVEGDVKSIFGAIRSFLSTAWDGITDEAKNGVSQEASIIKSAWNGILSFFKSIIGSVKSSVSSGFNSVESTIKSVWGSIVSFTGGIPSKLTGALRNLPSQVGGIGRQAMVDFLNGFKSVANSILSWVRGFASTVISAIKGILGVHSPSSVFFDIGKNLMLGMENGIKSHAQSVANAAKSAATKAAGATEGIAGGVPGAGNAGGSNEAIMRQLAAARGWTGSQWNALYAVEMREAGFSLTAQNPSSGAYGEAQFINGPSEYAQYGGNSTTAAGQATAMLNYIAQRYGSPEGAEAHEQAFGWYGAGGPVGNGWAGINDQGRELVHLPTGSTVIPHGQSEAMLSGASGGSRTLHVVIDGGGDDMAAVIAPFLRKHARFYFGGSAQAAYGYGGA